MLDFVGVVLIFWFYVLGFGLNIGIKNQPPESGRYDCIALGGRLLGGWQSFVFFILRGGDPGGAKKRQSGKEIEKRHQPDYRTKGGTGRRFSHLWQRHGHHKLNHFEANGGKQRATQQRLLLRLMSRQHPEYPQEQQIVGEDGD
ncbi:hypothetical protein D3C73_1128010 [compost metagenome]